MIKSVLFVCTGNTCRSVLAEYMFRKMAGDAKLAEIKVKSCGVASSPLFRVPDHVVEILKKEGIDCSEHRSTQTSQDLVDDADLILTMESHHKQITVAMFPGAAGKTFTLKPYLGISGDPGIPDPIGQSRLAYDACADEIKRCLQLLIDKIHAQG